MKNILNFNFTTVAILAGVLLLVAAVFWFNLAEVTTGVNEAGREVAGYVDGDEVDDVEGWGFIFGGAAVGFAGVFLGFVWIVAVLVPAALAVFMIIPAIIARLIYQNSDGRILAYRILMFFAYAWMGVLAYLLGGIVITGELTTTTIVFLVPLIYTVVMLILGIRNTYTGRIRGEFENELEANAEEF